MAEFDISRRGKRLLCFRVGSDCHGLVSVSLDSWSMAVESMARYIYLGAEGLFEAPARCLPPRQPSEVVVWWTAAINRIFFARC